MTLYIAESCDSSWPEPNELSDRCSFRKFPNFPNQFFSFICNIRAFSTGFVNILGSLQNESVRKMRVWGRCAYEQRERICVPNFDNTLSGKILFTEFENEDETFAWGSAVMGFIIWELSLSLGSNCWHIG